MDLLQIIDPSSSPAPSSDSSMSRSRLLLMYLKPLLANHSSITPPKRVAHLNFFHQQLKTYLDSAAPFIRSRKSPRFTGVPCYHSTIARSHIPFTVSLLYYKQQDQPYVRYTIDIPPSFYPGDRVSCLARAVVAVQSLEELKQETQGVQIFQPLMEVNGPVFIQGPQIKQQHQKLQPKQQHHPPNQTEQPHHLHDFFGLTAVITEFVKRHETSFHMLQCSLCPPSAVFLSFTLKEFYFLVGATWNFTPCQTPAATVASLNTIVTKARGADCRLQSAGWLNVWEKLVQYLTMNTTGMQITLFGVDSGNSMWRQGLRFKVHVKCKVKDGWSDVHRFLTLDGALEIGEGFGESCEEVWEALCVPADDGKDGNEMEVDEPGPTGQVSECTIVYTLTTTCDNTVEAIRQNHEPVWKTKLTTSLSLCRPHIRGNDAAVADVLIAFCPVLEGGLLLETFLKEKSDVVDDDDDDDEGGTEFIQEFQLSPSTDTEDGRGAMEVEVVLDVKGGAVCSDVIEKPS